MWKSPISQCFSLKLPPIFLPRYASPCKDWREVPGSREWAPQPCWASGGLQPHGLRVGGCAAQAHPASPGASPPALPQRSGLPAVRPGHRQVGMGCNQLHFPTRHLCRKRRAVPTRHLGQIASHMLPGYFILSGPHVQLLVLISGNGFVSRPTHQAPPFSSSTFPSSLHLPLKPLASLIWTQEPNLS